MYCYNRGYTAAEVDSYVSGVRQVVRSSGANFNVLESAVINDHMFELKDVDILGSVGAAVCETAADYIHRVERIFQSYVDQISLMPGHNVLTREDHEELVELVCFALRDRIRDDMMCKFVCNDYGIKGIEKAEDRRQYVSLIISVLADFMGDVVESDLLSHAAYTVADRYYRKAFGVSDF